MRRAALSVLALCIAARATAAPLPLTPSWVVETDQDYSSFGYSVATAGDVNGDGYSDCLVGAQFFDNGQTDEGRVYLYLGSPSGLGTTIAWSYESNEANARLGHSVASAGDVNGDGYDDVVVGALLQGADSGGRVSVFYGSATGLPPTPSLVLSPGQPFTNFGCAVACAGDVNADGYADVIIGADTWDVTQFGNEGAAFVYLGSAAGLSTTAAWFVASDQPMCNYGIAVASAFDVNADGYDDVLVGADYYDNGETNEGRAYLYLGGPGGPSTTPLWITEGNQVTFREAGVNYGVSVAGLGDVNGDGYADIAIGAHHYNSATVELAGRAWVFPGGPSGPATTTSWFVDGDRYGIHLGHSVATPGDVNGDGFADLAIGAFAEYNPEIVEGAVWLWLGSPTGLSAPSAPDWYVESNVTHQGLGCSVASAGDVNGDGYADLIAGGTGHEDGVHQTGRAFAWYGAGGALVPSVAWSAVSEQDTSGFGAGVASVGDVNGDGFDDVVVGAPFLDNGQANEGRASLYMGSAQGLSTTPAWTAEGNLANANFGSSVAGAGDVNGDGYADVAIGAPGWFDDGQTLEGAAFLYLGSPSGLSATPAWVGEGGQGGARYGSSVASAGDVNGDGFGDVVVGARLYDNGQFDEGRAFLYLGSGSGLSTTAAWTAEADQTGAFLGQAVACAGDVNADGYSDVLVSADYYDNGEIDEGRAYLYLGNASGLGATPAWTAEGNQPQLMSGEGVNFGTSVAGAGDVNDDGYSDVVIGAHHYTTDAVMWPLAGRAFVYTGSVAGLSANPVWTVDAFQWGAHLGQSVSCAGDVNGDGRSDVLVGAFQFTNGEIGEGAAYAFYGSPAGLPAVASWTVEGGIAGAGLGGAVDGACDVNGDGFGDVILGASGYENGPSLQGFVYVHYGGGRDGLDRVPRASRADGLAPIAPLGRSDSPTSFRIALSGRTPAGRGRIRVEREVKSGTGAFDGTGTVRGILADTGAPGSGGSVVALSELVSGLTPNTRYRWRARIVTPHVEFARSRWFTPAASAGTEVDLRTAPDVPTDAGGDAPPHASARIVSARSTAPRTAEASFALDREARVTLRVLDVRGRVVAELANGVLPAGPHAASWSAPRGIYVLDLRTADAHETRRVAIAR